MLKLNSILAAVGYKLHLDAKGEEHPEYFLVFQLEGELDGEFAGMRPVISYFPKGKEIEKLSKIQFGKDWNSKKVRDLIGSQFLLTVDDSKHYIADFELSDVVTEAKSQPYPVWAFEQAYHIECGFIGGKRTRPFFYHNLSLIKRRREGK